MVSSVLMTNFFHFDRLKKYKNRNVVNVNLLAPLACLSALESRTKLGICLKTVLCCWETALLTACGNMGEKSLLWLWTSAHTYTPGSTDNRWLGQVTWSRSVLFIFSLILMTYEPVCGLEWCDSIHTSTCGCWGLGACTRWTDEGRWACPEDRLAGGTETESDRNRRERDSEWERVKEGAGKARTVSENLAKKQDMDQSQGKSKAHSPWKHRRETGIVSLNIRPYFFHE